MINFAFIICFESYEPLFTIADRLIKLFEATGFLKKFQVTAEPAIR